MRILIISAFVIFGSFSLQSIAFGASTSTATLTISLQGTGTGTFVYQPKPLSENCNGVQCTTAFKKGANVKIMAKAARDSRFQLWSGTCKSKKNCAIKLKSDTNLTATFNLKTVSKPASVTPVDIQIHNFAFDKNFVTVGIGTRRLSGAWIHWINNDPVVHTITSDTGLFDSGNIASGGDFYFTFTVAGTYTYHCAIHPSMTGTITVKP